MVSPWGILVSIRINEDGKRVLDEVVQTSTHYGFRVWFGDVDERIKNEVMHELRLAPVLMEVYSSNLIALDVDGESDAQKLADYLNDAEEMGRLAYETSRLQGE